MIRESLNRFWNVRDEYKNSSLEELQEITDIGTRNFDVCILNISGDLNVGMIVRTAHLMGVRKVWIFGRKKFDNRSLVGSHNYTNVIHIHGLDSEDELDLYKFRDLLKNESLIPIYVEQGGTPIHEVKWDMPLYIEGGNEGIPCFIFGNESTGIPSDFMTNPDEMTVTVPQVGVIRSYNVAATASIVLWEYVRSMLKQNETETHPLTNQPH